MKAPKGLIEKLEFDLAMLKGNDYPLMPRKTLTEIQRQIEALLKEKQAIEEEIKARDSEITELESYIVFLKEQE